MERVAIITGTGIYQIPGVHLQSRVVSTPYGDALVQVGQGEEENLVFLTRHGPDHRTPPHKINYRANIKALKMLGVTRILATNAVGSINPVLPPGSLAVLSDFIDFTSGRQSTFFDGGSAGLAHTDMHDVYCPALRQALLAQAPAFGLSLVPEAVYVCTNGPRFETPAEIRMYGRLGADVVGMTGVPEAPLARELEMHYAAVAFSINWAAGVAGQAIEIDRQGLEALTPRLLDLFLQVLRLPLSADCPCTRSVMVMHPPQTGQGGDIL
ncbi:MAG: S-methyl-5'-thioinosine phosphorylase [Chloroflexi bacterium]|nr:MAG: S-methyl-5'-thioinosine phosphorylase [Chloroflexota bacterium]